MKSQTQENETDLAELLRRNQKLAALNEVIWVASRQKNLDEMLVTALQSVLDLVEREAAWIVLVDSNDVDTHLACSIGLPEDVARREGEEGFMDCECSQVDDKSFTHKTAVDDWISIHWNWACDILTPEQVQSLERYTRHLQLANLTL